MPRDRFVTLSEASSHPPYCATPAIVVRSNLGCLDTADRGMCDFLVCVMRFLQASVIDSAGYSVEGARANVSWSSNGASVS